MSISKQLVNKKVIKHIKQLSWNHLFCFFLCFGMIYLFGSGCSSNKNNDLNMTETIEEIGEVSQFLKATPSPFPTMMIPTESLLPTSMPTPMHEISEKLFLRESNCCCGGTSDLNWEFYWLNIACEDSLDKCTLLREPYFTFDYQFPEEALIQDFSNDKSNFLFIPGNPRYDKAYKLFQYDGELLYRRELKIMGATTGAAYSADNTKLVLIQGASDFFIINENRDNQYIYTDYWIHQPPSLSPDNRWIAFIAERKDEPRNCGDQHDGFTTYFRLNLIDLDNGEKFINTSARPVGDAGCHRSTYRNHILWNEDSNQIVYPGEVDKMDVLCTYHIDSETETCFDQYIFKWIDNYQLYNNQVIFVGTIDVFDPVNCSGQCINEGLDRNIYFLDLETAELRQITSGNETKGNPTWSENGDYIIYSKYVNHSSQIFLTDTYGSFHKQITFSNKNHYPNGMCSGY